MRNTILDQIYYSTVRVECGDGSVGTAYIVNTLHLLGEYGKIFLVSNNHVVKGKMGCHITFHRADSLENKEKIGVYRHKFKNLRWDKEWKSHPNPSIDLAILDLTPYLHELADLGIFLFYRSIPLADIPNYDEMSMIQAIEQVFFVGYPSGLIDKVNNLPIARKGHLATPLHENFGGEPLFLIDASVFGGSSGSPVFIINDGNGYTKTNGDITFGGTRFYLIGTIFEVHLQLTDRQNIDLGRVWKSQTILELIEFHFIPGIISSHNTFTATRFLTENPPLESNISS
ncbi:S1 family peptidase [Acinetobacter pittii]|uniref:S1 family peptidase n=1 Tax=Acinetobacter pittii TaxID=48296 RepID=UPI0032ED3907